MNKVDSNSPVPLYHQIAEKIRQSIAAGFLILARHSLSLMYDHISNAGFCDENDGQDTLGLRYGLDVLKQQGLAPTEIRLVGGGAKSLLWRQMVADVFDCPVVCPESSEAGAVGAALQAMWCYISQQRGAVAINELTDQFITLDESTRAVPDAATASQYAEIYNSYLQLNDTMKPFLEGRSG